MSNENNHILDNFDEDATQEVEAMVGYQATVANRLLRVTLAL